MSTDSTYNTYLGQRMLNDDDISKMIINKYTHLYLFNPQLTSQRRFIYIDATYSANFSGCTIKYLEIPEYHDDKFISYGDVTVSKEIHNKEFVVFTNESDAKVFIRNINGISMNPPVIFSNGGTVKQNYLKLYPTYPVKYQILITVNNTLNSKNSDDGYIITYYGEVRVQHYTNWKEIFRADYGSYFEAFKACEKFIQNHMSENPVYDNE